MIYELRYNPVLRQIVVLETTTDRRRVVCDVPNDAVGHLVLTQLDRHGMDFSRYWRVAGPFKDVNSL